MVVGIHAFPTSVIYWPSTEPSIKRCTSVNNRRNSGSRCTWDNYITRCHRRLGSVPVGVSWGTRCQRENQLAGSHWPTVEQPQPRWERTAATVKRTLGSICSSLSRPRLTSHTQSTSTLSRIKCERYIFIKKCVRLFIEVRILCGLCFRIYLYMFVAIQHQH